MLDLFETIDSSLLNLYRGTLFNNLPVFILVNAAAGRNEVAPRIPKDT
jgi:hypothetical protein